MNTLIWRYNVKKLIIMLAVCLALTPATVLAENNINLDLGVEMTWDALTDEAKEVLAVEMGYTESEISMIEDEIAAATLKTGFIADITLDLIPEFVSAGVEVGALYSQQDRQNDNVRYVNIPIYLIGRIELGGLYIQPQLGTIRRGVLSQSDDYFPADIIWIAGAKGGLRLDNWRIFLDVNGMYEDKANVGEPTFIAKVGLGISYILIE